MAYSDFTLEKSIKNFSLSYQDQADLFADVVELLVRPGLREALDENAPIAFGNNTEKARSELIVAPILLEVRRIKGGQIGFFSGITFDVVPEQGLSGVCDFLLCRGPHLLIPGPPALAVVEAKNDNMRSGFGQCVAEMVASRIFNERAGTGPTILFGVVTTGSLWRFLKLEASSLLIDRREYALQDLGKILGILSRCVGDPD